MKRLLLKASWLQIVQMKKDLTKIIADEKLKESETKQYINDCFFNGYFKTNGTGIDLI